MKNRILYGWSPRRALYLIGGIAVIVYAVVVKEWWGAPLGAYFALMGLFNWGCVRETVVMSHAGDTPIDRIRNNPMKK